MDEILRLTLLYDFYGELLTEKQRQTFEMHYQNDLSLSEIAEELSISRQAVLDQLKRTEKILIEYENKLCLVERFQEQKRAILKMKKILDDIAEGQAESMGAAVATMKEIADEILA